MDNGHMTVIRVPYRDADDKWVLTLRSPGQDGLCITEINDEPTARRLAACWNHCSLCSDKSLEDSVLMLRWTKEHAIFAALVKVAELAISSTRVPNDSLERNLQRKARAALALAGRGSE